jgi:hypothetical protein
MKIFHGCHKNTAWQYALQALFGNISPGKREGTLMGQSVFLLAIVAGIVCGILAAFKAGNPIVFILGFFAGLVLVVALYVLIAVLIIPAVRSLRKGSKKGVR